MRHYMTLSCINVCNYAYLDASIRKALSSYFVIALPSGRHCRLIQFYLIIINVCNYAYIYIYIYVLIA